MSAKSFKFGLLFAIFLLSWQFEVNAAPPQRQPFTSNRMPSMQSKGRNGTQEIEAPPVLQSVFHLPPNCAEGFELTGEHQRCRKKA